MLRGRSCSSSKHTPQMHRADRLEVTSVRQDGHGAWWQKTSVAFLLIVHSDHEDSSLTPQ